MITPASTTRVFAHDESGSGPPLVLLHAFPLAREMWRSQLTALSAGHRVIAPDLFGFGESPLLGGGWTVDSAADALATFLEEISVGPRIVLGGLSMGGYVALAFARRHPDRLAGLILADTKADADTSEGKKGRDEMIAFAQTNPAAAVVEKMLPKLLGDTTRSQRPAVVDEVKRIGAAQSAEGIVAALAALRDRPDATPGLNSVRVPTLVLVGAEDAVTPLADARKLADTIRGATLEVIPAAGHLANLETPTMFNETVRAFLATMSL
jgi:pimeloyl-ACP methyl ester carboxylesterase